MTRRGTADRPAARGPRRPPARAGARRVPVPAPAHAHAAAPAPAGSRVGAGRLSAGGRDRADRSRRGLGELAACLRERPAAGGAVGGARQPLPLRGRGARADRAGAGRERADARHRSPEGTSARLALGGRGDRHAALAGHAADRDPRARAAGPRGARAALPDGRGRRPDRDLWPAHRRLRPADRAGTARGRGGIAPGSGPPRRRAARGPRGAGRGDLGGLRPPVGRPARRAARGGRDAALRRPALSPAAAHLPEPAQGPRRARAGRRAIRPALPRTDLRQAARFAGRGRRARAFERGGATRRPRAGSGAKTREVAPAHVPRARATSRWRRYGRAHASRSAVPAYRTDSRRFLWPRRRIATSSAWTSGRTRSARSSRRSPTRAGWT